MRRMEAAVARTDCPAEEPISLKVRSKMKRKDLLRRFTPTPHSEYFKPHNILTLAVLPGPKEPSKHEINNYLYPIVNQLNWL